MMKIYDKKLAYPYFVWMTLFISGASDHRGVLCIYRCKAELSRWITSPSISGYGSVFARSLLLALIATVICLVIAFPVGYFLSRLRVNKQHIMLMLVMLPMWMNFLLRTYAWMGLLEHQRPGERRSGRCSALAPSICSTPPARWCWAWCITMCPI